MVNILCELRICTNIETSELFKKNQLENRTNRIKQYVVGLKKFFELTSEYIKNDVIKVYITDNTIIENDKLDNSILEIIHPKCEIITCNNNNYGCKNKGAGDIEQWLYCKDLIKKYNWFIHFEPRQLLQSNQFIDNFLQNPRNLFTYGGSYYNKDSNSLKHFNTGLFCIKTSYLINFIEKINLTNFNESIEYAIFNYFKTNNINFDILEKMDLFWFDAFTKRGYYM